ncbi:MAG: MarR family transcriptional regulator [Pseudomonadota bacterium]|nr:MarR family transcriptional regulator [Pseudomonadota bacterium]
MEKSQDALVLLRQIIRATDLHDKQLSRLTGLTMPQLMVMQTLRGNGPLTIGMLAKEMNLAQATVTSILDRLERKQLVRRERSHIDKRKVLACPTEAGLELLKSAPATLQDTFVREFEEMHDWEQSMIIASLERVSQILGAHHIDAAPMLDIGALDRATDGTFPDYPSEAPSSMKR